MGLGRGFGGAWAGEEEGVGWISLLRFLGVSERVVFGDGCGEWLVWVCGLVFVDVTVVHDMVF